MDFFYKDLERPFDAPETPGFYDLAENSSGFYGDGVGEFYPPIRDTNFMFIGNQDLAGVTRVGREAYIDILKNTDEFLGDNSTEAHALIERAWQGSLTVTASTQAGIPNTFLWLEGVQYTVETDSEGYVTHVTPLFRWTQGLLFRLTYQPALEIEWPL